MRTTQSKLGFLVLAAALMTAGSWSSVWAMAGTEGAAFLDIPSGAAPAALGSAYSALATDAYAPVWNPAGLGFLDSAQLAGQHLSYLESAHHEFVSLVVPLPQRQGVGFSVQYLGTGNIDSTLAGGAANGTFASHFAAYSLAYGKALTDRLSLGLTGKWINAKIADFSADAYAADLGALYRVNERISLAAVLANTGTKLKFIDDGDSLPVAMRFGAAWRASSRWQISGEGVYRKSGPASAHVGAQWRPIGMFALRAGYETDALRGLSAMAGLTAGAGVFLAGQELSYAWRPMDELGNTHYFSFVFRFGEKAASPDVLRREGRAFRSKDQAESQEEDRQLALLLDEKGDSHTKAPQGEKGEPK